MKVGQIWYHPLTGYGRPFIVEEISKGKVRSRNLDDGGEVIFSEKKLDKFLKKNPDFTLREERDGE